MRLGDTIATGEAKGSDYPRFKGSVKITLKDEVTGEVKTLEKHNTQTDALPDIFKGNFGGLLDYSNFADLFSTYLGGVLVFADPLGNDPTSYGIPAQTSNACVAHAGQVPLTSQNDDTTRGNPDDTKTVITRDSVKLVWTWSPSAGNAPRISALGLTHSEVGSYGCGRDSQAQKLLNPFAQVACQSKNYVYADDARAILAINDNIAYNFYLVDSTTVDIFKTPVNNTKFRLQGGALEPQTAYTTKITATIQNYKIASSGGCYYHFDFTNNKLILFGVDTQNGSLLLKDEIDLTSGAVTSSTITVTGCKLWKFTGQDNVTGYQNTPLTIPTRAMIYNNNLFVYGNRGTGDYDKHPTEIWKIDLANTGNISQVNTDLATPFDGQSGSRTNERFTNSGGLIVHDSFIINGDKVYPVNSKSAPISGNYIYSDPEGISAPVFGVGTNAQTNAISVNKCYLATLFNLDTPVEKTPTQSMSIEYTLTQTN